MQTGTAAFGHFYSQALVRLFWLLCEQIPEPPNSVVRDVNHYPQKYDCDILKSKDRAAH
jgi:hypothetical protein